MVFVPVHEPYWLINCLLVIKAKAVEDSNERSYNRTQHLPQRFEIVPIWADCLGKVVTGGALIQFRGAQFAQNS